MLPHMDKRWLLGGGVVAAGAIAYVLLRGGAPPEAAADRNRDGRVRVGPVREARAEVPREDPFAPKPLEKRKPKTWVDPVSGATNREIMDAVPDPEAAAREELTFRLRRLRLSASDAAAPCYGGGDSKEEITIKYSIVIKKEELHAEDVSVAENNISDPTVSACIVQAVRDMTSVVDKIPDMRDSYTLTMSLHDLYVRNRGGADKKPPPSDDLAPGSK
jgi:ribosomal protein L25 (general stress protein Ctc)